MPLFDLPFDELRAYRTRAQQPADLREFWTATLAAAREQATPPTVESVDNGVRVVDTYDVSFSGFGGDPIRAWYYRPAGAREDLPLVVRYQGYGGGRGLSHQVPLWALAGYATLDVDTRGQGSQHTPGHTPDPAGSGPAHPGYLTRGILDRDSYYYRRVFTDAVLAVDAAAALPGARTDRIAVAGGSQGGAISLAVASLRADVSAVLADVPFLSDFRRASEITAAAPYSELAGYLAVHRNLEERVFTTLDYFDVSVLCADAHAPALFSVGLMDQTCPPSTVFAAYNAYAGPKDIRVYRYNDHEGGQSFHETEQLAWLDQHLRREAQPMR